MSQSTQAVTIQALIVPRPEHVQDVETEMLAMVQASRAESGCQRYDLLRVDRPDGTVEFHVQERYDDMTAVQAHRDSAHYQAYRSRAGDWFAQPPAVTLLRDVDVAG
ncbi:antibiotic biosynthesis monooxygenase [Deinococcus sp. KNUC1210]|uniref:putative quinol monooxygenase n=1 Tax=Deinococcus sp. KNUC1210 TaxID=2917691 RepID=UPI001EF0E401|nr:putative quinol monooxygenase [Deinococcus sp. KNUC1210]ULH16105.1 antibiotic biosynthesis monooxygenase [Deinococcus sp. KNUC1210]